MRILQRWLGKLAQRFEIALVSTVLAKQPRIVLRLSKPPFKAAELHVRSAQHTVPHALVPRSQQRRRVSPVTSVASMQRGLRSEPPLVQPSIDPPQHWAPVPVAFTGSASLRKVRCTPRAI